MRESFRIISFLFHPLVLPLYGFAVLILVSPEEFRYSAESLSKVQAQFFVNMILFPLIALILMIALGFVKDFYLTDRRQRVAPLMATMIFYWWTNFMFGRRIEVPEIMELLTTGAFIGVVLAFMITMVLFKISLHAIGMGVIIGLVVALGPISDISVLLILLAAIVVAGCVGTARLMVGEHNNKEVYSGYAVGLASQLLAMIFVNPNTV